MGLLTRITAAGRVLFGADVLIIERRFDTEKKKDRITLWGTMQNKEDQIKVLHTLADSINADLQNEKLTNLATQTN